MNKPTFIMMVGLPCSGKSTYAEKLSKEYNAVVHSSDALREELTGDINNQDNNELVFQTLHKRIKEDLQNGTSCIYDACQVSRKSRMSFLQQLNKIPCRKICVLMATRYRYCIERGRTRERTVPGYVIERMHKKFDPPYWYEGWDDIQIIYEENSKDSLGLPVHWLETVKDFDQDNTHHSLTLGEHCEKTWDYICRNYDDYDTDEFHSLRIAAILHDNGKCCTKAYKNSKGEITDEAHYYTHEHTGSYNCLFYKMLCNPLDVAVLIRWHMQPYFWEKDAENGEKTMNKYKKLWGEELFNNIMRLHEADKKAH